MVLKIQGVQPNRCLTHHTKKNITWISSQEKNHKTLPYKLVLNMKIIRIIKTRLIRLRAVDGYASDITRYSIDPSYNPHSYSPLLVLQPTFDLWPWVDLGKNLISSSTPGSAPLYQVWWKSTQGFLRYCVNDVKIAYFDQVHWPLTFDLGRISPKIWSVHLLSVVHPCTKFDENPPRGSWDFALMR